MGSQVWLAGGSTSHPPTPRTHVRMLHHGSSSLAASRCDTPVLVQATCERVVGWRVRRATTAVMGGRAAGGREGRRVATRRHNKFQIHPPWRGRAGSI